MLVLQYQFTKLTEDEMELISEFNEWLCDQIFETINTKINRKKISIRLAYLNKVRWIKWIKTGYLSVQEIMETIHSSIKAQEFKNNLWKIEIDENVLVPNTATSISRLIRFLNYGDINYKGTGMFTKLETKFDHRFLIGMWRIFITRNLGRLSEAKIISK